MADVLDFSSKEIPRFNLSSKNLGRTFIMMGIDRLIRSLIAVGLILGTMGTLDEAIHQLAHKATGAHLLSLSKAQSGFGRRNEMNLVSFPCVLPHK